MRRFLVLETGIAQLKDTLFIDNPKRPFTLKRTPDKSTGIRVLLQRDFSLDRTFPSVIMIDKSAIGAASSSSSSSTSSSSSAAPVACANYVERSIDPTVRQFSLQQWEAILSRENP